MKYKELIENSYANECLYTEGGKDKAYFVCQLFDFWTYDSELDYMFADRILSVFMAITDKTNFEYIKDEESYRWYIAIFNQYSDWLEYGTSPRGVWWCDVELKVCCLWDMDNEQILHKKFTREEWEKFIRALNDWYFGA